MLKLFLFLGMLLLACLGIIYFFSRPHQIITPLVKTPLSYDLSSILEKNGLVATTPITVNGAVLASVSGILVSFSPEKDFLQQVRALQLVLPKVKMDEKRVFEIDLRFNKVVIKYAER